MTTVDLSHARRVHLIGVGGAGMSGLARMLLERGHHVSGSDLHEGLMLDTLRAMGATVTVGHAAAAVDGADVVVVSSAVPERNPELAEARRRGLTVLHRSEMLASLMRERRGVLVSGTHGKTTTTAMLVAALQSAGLDPSFSIGAALNESGANAHEGTGDIFVAEADESDRSFLVFTPDLALVTNVELDHPDEFADEAAVHAAFLAFAGRRTPDAPLVACLDDDGAATLASEVRPPVVTYGEDPRADVRLVVSGPGTGEVHRGGERPVPLTLAVPGRHNLLNATGALAACVALGADVDAAAAGLARFTGPQRRFQRLGRARDVLVVDDYAHNPAKLRAALGAAREETEGRVVVVVQPHRYSRTAALGAELGRAAAAADLVVVTEVYGAGEEPVPGVSGRLVADAARAAGGEVVWEPHLDDVAEVVGARVGPGDLVLVTGAGDVTQVGPALLDLLRGGHG